VCGRRSDAAQHGVQRVTDLAIVACQRRHGTAQQARIYRKACVQVGQQVALDVDDEGDLFAAAGLGLR
jgi:hypothetical protein